MIDSTQYRGMIKCRGQVLYSTENDCPIKLFVNLLCKLEDEFHDAEALVTKQATGEIIYQGRRSAIC